MRFDQMEAPASTELIAKRPDQTYQPDKRVMIRDELHRVSIGAD